VGKDLTVCDPVGTRTQDPYIKRAGVVLLKELQYAPVAVINVFYLVNKVRTSFWAVNVNGDHYYFSRNSDSTSLTACFNS
jgi:hypothetical protein